VSNDVSLGLAHEAEVTLHKAGATAKNFWDPISRNVKLAKEVVRLVEKRLAVVRLALDLVLRYKPEIQFSLDPPPPPWRKILDDGENSTSFAFKNLEIVEFLDKRRKNNHVESEINGEEMIRRAKAKSAYLNQHFAEVLIENQQVLPEEWQEYNFSFPATMWEYQDWRVIPYMVYRKNERVWVLTFTRITDGKYRIGVPGNYDFGDVDSYDRLLRLRKT